MTCVYLLDDERLNKLSDLFKDPFIRVEKVAIVVSGDITQLLVSYIDLDQVLKRIKI